MKTPTKRGLAMWLLVLALMFGGTAAVKLICLLTGVYNPVVQDQLSPEPAALMPWRLAGIVALSLMVGTLSFRYVRVTTPNA